MLTKEQVEHYHSLKKAAIAILDSGELVSAPAAMTQLIRLQQLLCGHLVTDDGELVEVPSYRVDALLDCIEEMDGKIIIWSRFRYDIRKIEAALKGMLKPEFEEAQLGTAEVREVFKSSKFGTIAGCLVQSGEVKRNAKARLIRDGAVVADNLSIAGLRRFKDDVTEVREGFECGINLGSYQDVKVDDVIETFEMREKKRPA